MKDNITPKKYGYENIAVVSGYDINVNLIEKCIELDKTYYPDSTTNPKDIKSWVFDYPQFCFVMMNEKTDEVVGYLYCFPLGENATLEFLQGKRTFKSLKKDDFDDLISEGIYNLYIASLCLSDDYHDGFVRRLLFECFVNQAIQFAKRDMFINYIFMELASDFEKEVCQLFAIDKITTNKLGREIYGGLFDLGRYIKLDNYDALCAVYGTIHAEEILKFKKDYTEIVKAKKK